MTVEELREKIVNIAISTVWKDCYGDEVVIDRVAAEQLADALIKANIGDVEELQFENSVLKQTNFFLKAGVMSIEEDRQVWIKKWKEEEHKADVAEKALDLCETAYILSLNHRATEGISGQAIASDLGVHKFFMEQAEKELAEEGKDEER